MSRKGDWGEHIALFLVDGEAGGITTADVSGWTGHILVGPRTRLTHLLKREEASSNGVYLLLGDDPECIGGVRCYIGKTENFIRRFREHDRQKDWWDRAILVSSREEAFNEGLWGFLEARMIKVAREVQRASVKDNEQLPREPKLSEAQKCDAEKFFTEMCLILPVLGVQVFRETRSRRRETPKDDDNESPVFRLVVPTNDVEASAQVVDGEFLLRKGSRIKANVGRRYESTRARQQQLLAEGAITIEGHVGIVQRDIAFLSPSAAGRLVTGRSCNGRTSWKWNDHGQEKTYAQWEERGLEG